MGQCFTRQELYDLVWSQPMKTLATSFKISDVALAKTCRKAGIPVPERGYWAKKHAGKRAERTPLPPRFPGAPNEISVAGGGRYQYQYDYWDQASRKRLLTEPLPAPPTFDEEVDSVIERIKKMVGKVRCPDLTSTAHGLVAKLLVEDEERRTEFLKTGYSWDKPRYDDGVEQRRLRILNAIFIAAVRAGCSPSMSTSRYQQEDRDVSIRVGGQHVSFTLEPIKARPRDTTTRKPKERLRLVLGSRHSTCAPSISWEDTDERKLESALTEIVVEILTEGERRYRRGEMGHHKWLVEQNAQLQEEERQRKIEAERKARELREKRAKERIDRLLAQASALHQANTIRIYVNSVLGRSAEIPIQADQLSQWAAWARSEADRIDPIPSGIVIEAAQSLAHAHTMGGDAEGSTTEGACLASEAAETDA
jgi:hypothetical protein